MFRTILLMIFWAMILAMIVYCIAGCTELATSGNGLAVDPNTVRPWVDLGVAVGRVARPEGIDPNAVRPWVDFGVTVGRAAQAGGAATGNPAMIAYGAALVALGGYITNTILKKG